jgi:hypothetical protein
MTLVRIPLDVSTTAALALGTFRASDVKENIDSPFPSPHIVGREV